MNWGGRKLKSLIFRNGTLKVFSLAFACGLWLLVNAGERDTEKTLVVPIELRNLPSQMVVIGPQVESVDLQVMGPRTLLGQFNPRKITLDLSRVRPGSATFRVSADLLSLPRGVKVERISPSQVNLEIAAIIRRTVPVQPNLVGKPPPGFTVKEVAVVPNSVDIVGPAPEVEKIDAVPTAAIDVERLTQPQTRELLLREPEGDLLTYNVERVRVRIDIQEVITTREFRRVKISVKNAGFRVLVTPSQVDVFVRGPQPLVEQLALWDGEVFVDAAGQGPGTVFLPVNVLLPPRIELVSQEPAEVEVKLLEDPPKKPAQKQTPDAKKPARGRS
jgi:YbbR domain-containing protein